MNEVKFDHTKETLLDILGISESRAKELEHATDISMWELKHPDRDGFSSAELLEAFVKHALTPAEITFQAFIGGAYFQGECKDEEDEFDEVEEEEEKLWN